jgi:peptidoglycan/LPS O-acetylase OafA/YrhL
LGKVSYAIYVFHPFVLMWVNRRLYASTGSPFYGNFYLAVLAELALYLILTFAAAPLSWVLFEHPILNLKDRFTYGVARVSRGGAQPAEALP